MRRLLQHRAGAAYRADINVTPLVDVVLVLLIIFMVITPMLQRGVEVHLPESLHHQQATNPTEPLVVSVNRQGEYFLEQEKLGEADLETRIRSEIIRLPGREILLKGDEELTYGQVRTVLLLIQRIGAGTVALATVRPGER